MKSKVYTETFRLFPKVDKRSWFYKNCKRQRKNDAKICRMCPFRTGIEEQEAKCSS